MSANDSYWLEHNLIVIPANTNAQLHILPLDGFALGIANATKEIFLGGNNSQCTKSD